MIEWLKNSLNEIEYSDIFSTACLPLIHYSLIVASRERGFMTVSYSFPFQECDNEWRSVPPVKGLTNSNPIILSVEKTERS